jgi:hypothetical protein
VVYASGPLLSATGSGAGHGYPGAETLIPLHEAYAGQLSSQGVQSIQNLLGLKANFPAERLRNADHYLGDALFADQPAQDPGDVRARDYVEGACDQAVGIRDGDAGANVTEVEGSDTLTVV